MFQIEDPLSMADLKVTDISSARFALKAANDYHFAVIHMRAEMEKALARSRQENQAQALKLIQQFVFITTSEGFTRPISYIPEPLPEEVPQWVRTGIAQMASQLEKETERAEAELAQDSEPLLEMEDILCDKVKTWFVAQVRNRPQWLGSFTEITLGGCTLQYSGGNVTFNFSELNYD